MKIWTLNHYAGTANSPSTRHYDLNKILARRGHDVTIFASGFSHYTFREERLEPGEDWKQEIHDAVKFIWIRTVPYSANDSRRARNMLSFAWRSVMVGRKLPKPDVIIGSSVHPFAVLAGYVLSQLKGAKFVFEVRDLWPQHLIDTGALSEKHPLALAFRWMEKFLYRKADLIITLLPHAHEYMTARGIPRDKIVWIPNGADLSRFERVPPYHGGNSESFKLVYFGAHGRANALDVVLDAAKILQDGGHHHINFLFVGSGAQKESLIRRTQTENLRHVEFRDLIPKGEIPRLMGEAEAFVFCLEDAPLFKYGVSANKLFDYFASRRPILFVVNSGNDPVTEADAGFHVPPRNPQALADAALKLASLPPERRIEMGQNGYAYVSKNHDMRLLAEKLERTLSQLVGTE